MAMDATKTLNQFIERHLGLSYTAGQTTRLLGGIQQAAGLLNRPKDMDSLVQWLDSTELPRHELETLAQCLTVGETYFFRELPGLMLLIEQVLPRLQSESDFELNLWSAGCSTGEEPYSLAILLKEHAGSMNNLKINILATDINKSALEKASAGLYSPWSFRGVSASIKSRYFTPYGKLLKLNKEIAEMVTFRSLNLAADAFPIPSGKNQFWDMIFCRNVLMYMPVARIEEIALKFGQALKTGGWLVTSQVELNDQYFSNFQRELIHRGIYYRKPCGSIAPKPRPWFVNEASETISDQKKSLTNPVIRKIATTRKPAANTHSETGMAGRRERPPASRNGISMTGSPERHAAYLYQLGDYNRCKDFCQESLVQYPAHPEIAHYLISSLRNLGKHSDAFNEITALIQSDPMNQAFWLIAGNLHLEMSDFESAEPCFSKVLYLHPESVEARYGSFLVHLATEDHSRARKDLNNLLQSLTLIEEHSVLEGMDGLSAGRFREILETYNLLLK